MHPIKDFYHRDKDLTQKFKGCVSSIIAEAKKALVLADCDCPYPAESQMSKILSSVREATQVVHTVANDYQYRVPATDEKEAQTREAWGKAKEPESAESFAVPEAETFSEMDAKAFLNELCKQYGAETGEVIYNCCPGANSAGDFALWLAKRIKALQMRVVRLRNADRLLAKADTIVNAHDKYTELVSILSEPDLQRPDGSPCYCDPDAPNRMEDFGTSSEYGVCDGAGAEDRGCAFCSRPRADAFGDCGLRQERGGGMTNALTWTTSALVLGIPILVLADTFLDLFRGGSKKEK